MKKHFKLVDVITVPTKGGYYKVLKNSYWACKDKEGKEAYVFIGHDGKANSPQCNSLEGIMKNNSKNIILNEGDDVNIVFIETAYLPIRISDYYER